MTKAAYSLVKRTRFDPEREASWGRWHMIRKTGRMGKENVALALELLADPIPEPEQAARDAQPHEIPRSAKALADTARSAGWTVRVTYARGPRLHSVTGKVTRIVDSIAVRMRRGEQRAWGVWTDGKFDAAQARNDGHPPVDLGARDVVAHVKEGTRP